MTIQEMLSHVDHTLLKPYATWGEIQKLCEEAIRYHTASVCVPPAYVKRIHDTYGEKVRICTVVGFPLGYSVTAAKAAEVETALAEGCYLTGEEKLAMCKAVTAAGGISTLEDLQMFLELGCDRIGTSRAVGLCKE